MSAEWAMHVQKTNRGVAYCMHVFFVTLNKKKQKLRTRHHFHAMNHDYFVCYNYLGGNFRQQYSVASRYFVTFYGRLKSKTISKFFKSFDLGILGI